MADTADQQVKTPAEQLEAERQQELADRNRGEEIDLNDEEEAALDRAWERIRRREALRQRQGVGTGKDTDE